MSGEACRELEWVDAEAPDWSASAAPALDLHADGEALRAEQAALRADAERRAARPRTPVVLPPPWQDRCVAACSFCVIDVETTKSAGGRDDEVVEIGAVHVHALEIGREFATRVQPGTLASAHVAADTVAPTLPQALPWLLEMARDRVLVFHNAPFDLPLLQRACVETHRDPLAQPVLDTVVLARRLLGAPCSLGRVAARLGLAVDVLHRALEDARLTARVLIELLQVCIQAGNVRLCEIPGVRSASAHARRRRGPRCDPLLERLERGIATRETLQISYHGGAGLAPCGLVLRPERLAGNTLMAFDVERRRMVWLEVARIGWVHAAS